MHLWVDWKDDLIRLNSQRSATATAISIAAPVPNQVLNAGILLRGWHTEWSNTHVTNGVIFSRWAKLVSTNTDTIDPTEPPACETRINIHFEPRTGLTHGCEHEEDQYRCDGFPFASRYRSVFNSRSWVIMTTKRQWLTSSSNDKSRNIVQSSQKYQLLRWGW